jgi:eukaryotic-like serine/threonine-protein kinase
MRRVKSSAALTALWSATVSALMFLVMYYFVSPRLPVTAAEVPPLIGLSPEQARGLLEPRGLLLAIDGEVPSSTVAAGSLAEQRPLGGSRLRRGDEVHASLARPAPPLQVPTVAGMTVDAAKDALTKLKLKVGKTTEAPSDATARGLVVATTPAAGEEVRADSAIDLTVSGGPATKTVPAVVGKSLSKAKGLIETAGFAVGATKYGSHDDYDTGVVIKQNPAAGALASPGVKIDLTVND